MVGVRLEVIGVGVVIILLSKKGRFLFGGGCVVWFIYLHQNKVKCFLENYFQYFKFVFG